MKYSNVPDNLRLLCPYIGLVLLDKKGKETKILLSRAVVENLDYRFDIIADPKKIYYIRDESSLKIELKEFFYNSIIKEIHYHFCVKAICNRMITPPSQYAGS